jgi:hypothetical protein
VTRVGRGGGAASAAKPLRPRLRPAASLLLLLHPVLQALHPASRTRTQNALPLRPPRGLYPPPHGGMGISWYRNVEHIGATFGAPNNINIFGIICWRRLPHFHICGFVPHMWPIFSTYFRTFGATPTRPFASTIHICSHTWSKIHPHKKSTYVGVGVHISVLAYMGMGMGGCPLSLRRQAFSLPIARTRRRSKVRSLISQLRIATSEPDRPKLTPCLPPASQKG